MAMENGAATERRRAFRHRTAMAVCGFGALLAAASGVLWEKNGLDRHALLSIATFSGIAIVFAGVIGLFAYRPDTAEQTRNQTGSYRDRVQRSWVGGITILPAATFGLTVIAMTRSQEWLSGEDTSWSGVIFAGVAVLNLLLIPLMLMGWDGGSKKIKRLIEDELTRSYRASAITCAFWVLLVGVAGAYLVGLWNPEAVIVGLPMILWVSATTAALRFAQLHRRAEREMEADE
ncbi:MAG: hypothetical protein EON86_18670 [Brevundimonas sp.]|nr:MAG: hypothetical protein EON86_18670 [Brevundimonas sp.]